MKQKKFKIRDHVKKLIWENFQNRLLLMAFLGVSDSSINRWFAKHSDVLTQKNVKDFIIETFGGQAKEAGFTLETDSDIYELVNEPQIQAA